ncbi:hypothetical protein F4604DRAFT_1739042 [Suillus subluteus]|nr:hypothetical protein F4604DRAFT_1739042 [Suillus subluteus]
MRPPPSPFRYEIPQHSPTPDPPPHLDDSDVPAPLDADERILMDEIYTHVKRDDLRHSLAFTSQTQAASLNDECTVPPSSGESQATSPSSDSAPLPGSSTLTFLAAALSNASLEGVPPAFHRPLRLLRLHWREKFPSSLARKREVRQTQTTFSSQVWDRQQHEISVVSNGKPNARRALSQSSQHTGMASLPNRERPMSLARSLPTL